MERGYSVETEVSPGFSPDYVLYLFNEQEHLNLQGGDWLTFYLLKKASHKILAQVSFHMQKDKAVSPFRAPFGSFLYSPNLSTLTLFNFIKECEGRLKKKHIRLISLKEPPLFYDTRRELLHSVLINLGYLGMNAEIGAGIHVDDEKFSSKIQTWEKRKLRQAKEKGMIVRRLPLSELETLYNFILKCRMQRGWGLSMTFEELNRTVNSFDDSFFLFGTFLHKELTSASISIQVHPGILYNFYSAHHKKFDAVSPIVLLINEMYKFCASNKMEWLDLGTSAIEGQPNFSLLDFKFRLGAQPSMKLTFEKELV